MSEKVKLIIEIPKGAKQAFDIANDLKGGYYDHGGIIGKAIQNGIPLDENKREWIPVSERLPEIHQNVLLSLRSLDVEVGFRAETEPYFYCHGADGCYVEPQNVLAWQPLPEPYKAESEVKPNDHNKV